MVDPFTHCERCGDELTTFGNLPRPLCARCCPDPVHLAEQDALQVMRAFVEKFPPRMVETLGRDMTYVEFGEIRRMKHALDHLDRLSCDPDATRPLDPKGAA